MVCEIELGLGELSGDLELGHGELSVRWNWDLVSSSRPTFYLLHDEMELELDELSVRWDLVSIVCEVEFGLGE